MEIHRNRYAQGHLDELVASSGIDDWFTFLDRPSRLIDLLKTAKPFFSQTIEEDGECFYWSDVGLLIFGDFFGLWPNPSNAELFVAERVDNLNLLWIESSCWSLSDTDEAKQILENYQKIISYETPEQLYHEKVTAYQSKTGAVETVQEYERVGADHRLAWGDWYYSKKGSRNG